LCETQLVRRVPLAVSAFALAATAASLPVASGQAASPSWSGSATCTISVTGPGYQHSETQKWQVNGAPTTRGAFHFVASQWTDTGSGSSETTQGDQSLDITWTVKAAEPGKFQFVVRASDGKLLIGQANAQLRAPSGITGMQKQTIGGVAQTPSPFDLEAFETQLPRIVVGPTVTHVSGSTPATVVKGSFGPFQPGAATATKSCSWRFNRSA
jgi:hypothetical protein